MLIQDALNMEETTLNELLHKIWQITEFLRQDTCRLPPKIGISPYQFTIEWPEYIKTLNRCSTKLFELTKPIDSIKSHKWCVNKIKKTYKLFILNGYSEWNNMVYVIQATFNNLPCLFLDHIDGKLED
jgi:hypothetical protein